MSTKLLICSVGGSPDPLVHTARHHRPGRIRFVASRESAPSIDTTILPALAPLRPDQTDRTIVRSADHFADCVEDLQLLNPIVNDWLFRPDAEVVIDLTGGTKAMSAALAFVARPWLCSFHYVSGTQRTKDGLGTVVPGSEVPVPTSNPWRSLGHQVVETATQLFDAGLPEAAARAIETQLKHAREDLKRQIATLHQLAKGYALWDRFQHSLAEAELKRVYSNSADLRVLFPSNYPQVRSALEDHRKWLFDIKSSPRNLLLDLVANSCRSGRLGRFDDATARLYRAVEWMAQTRLRELGLLSPNAGHLVLDRVPPALLQEWDPRIQAGKLRLGLQDNYVLLDRVQDPLGKRFAESRLGKRNESLLEVRNQSILAHGSNPVEEGTWQELLGVVIQLAEIDRRDLDRLVFPRLTASANSLL